MSNGRGPSLVPLILDASILTAIARADVDIMTLILDYHAGRQPIIAPALAVTAASLDMPGEDAADFLGGLELLPSVMVAPLQGAEQAVRLAAVIASTGLDAWDAHVAAVADSAICPILTLDGDKWRQLRADLDEPLQIIEIADPEG